MPIALVAHTTHASATTGTTGAINCTGANLLIIAISWYNGAAPTLGSVSDSSGNSWTQVGTDQTSNGASTTRLYAAVNATVTSAQTFTFTASGGNIYASVCVAAFSGAATAPIDIGAGPARTAQATSAGALTPTHSGALLIAAISPGGTVNTTAIGSSFTISDNVAYSSGVNQSGAMAYLIQTTAISENPTWTVGSGTPGTILASFLPSGATNPSTAPTIDGTATGSQHGGTTISATLTTIHANDVIGVVVFAEMASGTATPAPTITAVSGTGTTGWAQRAVTSQANVGGQGWALSYWTGTAAAALSAVTITATLNHTIDSAGMVAFGVNGTNTSSPFDTNGSIPAAVQGTHNINPTATISTSGANDLLVAFTGVGNTSGNKNTPISPQWTLIGQGTNFGGSIGAICAGIYYGALAEVQGSIPITWNDGTQQISTADNIPLIVDAFAFGAPLAAGAPQSMVSVL